MKKIRKKSKLVCEKLGVPFPDHLPLLDENMKLRPLNESLNRAFALHVIIHVSYGMDKQKAKQWLGQENCLSFLTEDEAILLERSDKDIEYDVQCRIYALHLIAWAIGLYPTFGFTEDLSDDLVDAFPEEKSMQNFDFFRKKAKYKSEKELIQLLDTSYCLHWYFVDRVLADDIESISHFYGLPYRRHALEWMLSDDDWDDISLDT